MCEQIEDQNLVSFLPLDVTVEDSVNTILSHIDNMMQYGEDEEPKVNTAPFMASKVSADATRCQKTWTTGTLTMMCSMKSSPAG